MRHPMPMIQEFMTKTPICVDSKTTLKEANDVMHAHNIRHLPIKKDSKVVGIISKKILTSALMLEQAGTLNVEDIMFTDPFIVSPQTSLDSVLTTMAEDKYGSVIVVDDNEVVGIFTTVDVCRVFVQILNQVYVS